MAPRGRPKIFKKCLVRQCRHEEKDNCKFFGFPREEVMKNVWAQMIGFEGEIKPNSKLCHCHFPRKLRSFGPKYGVSNVPIVIPPDDVVLPSQGHYQTRSQNRREKKRSFSMEEASKAIKKHHKSPRKRQHYILRKKANFQGRQLRGVGKYNFPQKAIFDGPPEQLLSVTRSGQTFRGLADSGSTNKATNVKRKRKKYKSVKQTAILENQRDTDSRTCVRKQKLEEIHDVPTEIVDKKSKFGTKHILHKSTTIDTNQDELISNVHSNTASHMSSSHTLQKRKSNAVNIAATSKSPVLIKEKNSNVPKVYNVKSLFGTRQVPLILQRSRPGFRKSLETSVTATSSNQGTMHRLVTSTTEKKGPLIKIISRTSSMSASNTSSCSTMSTSANATHSVVPTTHEIVVTSSNQVPHSSVSSKPIVVFPSPSATIIQEDPKKSCEVAVDSNENTAEKAVDIHPSLEKDNLQSSVNKHDKEDTEEEICIINSVMDEETQSEVDDIPRPAFSPLSVDVEVQNVNRRGFLTEEINQRVPIPSPTQSEMEDLSRDLPSFQQSPPRIVDSLPSFNDFQKPTSSRFMPRHDRKNTPSSSFRRRPTLPSLLSSERTRMKTNFDAVDLMFLSASWSIKKFPWHVRLNIMNKLHKEVTGAVLRQRQIF